MAEVALRPRKLAQADLANAGAPARRRLPRLADDVRADDVAFRTRARLAVVRALPPTHRAKYTAAFGDFRVMMAELALRDLCGACWHVGTEASVYARDCALACVRRARADVVNKKAADALATAQATRAAAPPPPLADVLTLFGLRSGRAARVVVPRDRLQTCGVKNALLVFGDAAVRSRGLARSYRLAAPNPRLSELAELGKDTFASPYDLACVCSAFPAVAFSVCRHLRAGGHVAMVVPYASGVAGMENVVAVMCATFASVAFCRGESGLCFLWKGYVRPPAAVVVGMERRLNRDGRCLSDAAAASLGCRAALAVFRRAVSAFAPVPRPCITDDILDAQARMGATGLELARLRATTEAARRRRQRMQSQRPEPHALVNFAESLME